MRLWQSLSPLLGGHRVRVAIVAVSAILGGFVEALFLVIITRTAFAVSDGRDTFGVVAGRDLGISAVVLVGIALVLLRVGFSLLGGWQSATLCAEVSASLRRELSGAYLRADWSTQHDDISGQLQDLLTSFSSSGAAIVASLLNAITSGLSLVALLLFAVLVDPIAALVTMVAVGVLIVLIRPIRQRVRRASAESARAGIAFAAHVNEVSRLGLEMHVFDTREPMREHLDDAIGERARIERRVGIMAGLVPTVYNGVAYLALLLALAVVAAADQADLRSVGAVMLVMLRSLSYGQGLQTSLTSINASRPFLAEIDDRRNRYLGSSAHRGDEPLERVEALTLDHVDFAYQSDTPVLTDVSVSFRPGEIVGLVGPSGSGKSTLVQLLLGLRRPTQGTVTCNGRHIEQFRAEDWARRVTFVPQHPQLIDGSIADNVRFFREDVSDAEIASAVRRAHLDSDVATWPDGLHHQVGSGGSKLSGGQQQRVCIARALVERPDVLVLDEPTSALDTASELAIRQTLAQLRGEVTVIIVAHRLSTLEICDRLLGMSDCTIAEVEPEAAMSVLVQGRSPEPANRPHAAPS